MPPRTLPTSLAAIIDRTESTDELRSLLDGTPGVESFDDDRYIVEGMFAQLGSTDALRALHEILRRLEPLGLGFAPAVIAYREMKSGRAILVTRYSSSPRERISPVVSSNGPFRNAAKAAFRRDFERLLDAGFVHPHAIHSHESWMISEDSGALLLDSWWMLQEEHDSEDREDALQRIADLLSRLPLRRRVAKKAEELRRVLGHVSLADDPQTLLLIEHAGYPLEAELRGAQLRGVVVTTVADGPWHGRTAYLEPDAPDAKLGDLWFDSREMNVMLRIRSGWLALRALEPWQCVGLPPAITPSCITGCAGDPIVNLTWHEAAAITEAFRKTLPGREDWLIAREGLPRSLFESLWSDLRAEWTSTTSPAAPDEVAFVSRLNLLYKFQSGATEDAGRASLSRRSVTARRDDRDPRLTMRTFLRVPG